MDRSSSVLLILLSLSDRVASIFMVQTDIFQTAQPARILLLVYCVGITRDKDFVILSKCFESLGNCSFVNPLRINVAIPAMTRFRLLRIIFFHRFLILFNLQDLSGFVINNGCISYATLSCVKLKMIEQIILQKIK